MDRPLKIAISLWMFKPGTGGLQGHAEQLCRELQARGHEVVLITRAYTHVPKFLDYLYFNETTGDAQVNGVTVRPLIFSKSWRPVQWALSKCVHRPQLRHLGVWMYRLQARQQARRSWAGFDVVHHIGQATALIGYAAEDAARHWNVPFVVQPTCHPGHIGDSPLDLELYRKADRLLVHTEFEAGFFREHLKMPIDIVGNGIEDRSNGDAARFRAEYGIEGNFILYIGRKDADKGYPLVMEAFRRLHRKREGIKLVCMGPPGEVNFEQKPEGMIDLEFVSEQTKHDALAACMCLCVPSEGESFGLVFMEAGRYRKPVVARRLPVLQELLDCGRAGLLLGQLDEKRNSVSLDPEELCNGLLQLTDNPNICSQLGERCRIVSETFVWPRVVERFEQAYHNVIC